MVDQNLIKELENETDLEAEFEAVFAEGLSDSAVDGIIDHRQEEFIPGAILEGRVVGLHGNDVVVDVGLKSEGVIAGSEFDDLSTVAVGDEVQVLLETVESDSGHIVLSKRKADRILNWQRIVATKNEGDTIQGRVMRKIKGGLLVDIGYPVFLPASQVDIRRPGNIEGFIGREIEAKILKIDTDRRNIVISRRRLIEEERLSAKEALFKVVEIGQTRKGTVKNIADFGAFVDLGGIDGLLHITDMSWDRVGHPSEVVRIDEEIEVKVLNIDRDKEKIALGLKQLRPNPWEEIEQRCPVDSKIKGEVVNIMNYGAFIKIEPGVEGLVHISEMSWTRRINHPSEMLEVGDEIEVVVLDINRNKQEISLGIKQTTVNPWTRIAEKYPPNTRMKGRLRNLTNYGAFIEIEEGIDGLLHVSDMSWTKKISHPSEILKKGEEVECVILKIDEDKQRIALGLKQLHEDPWVREVPENYIPGQIVEGTVTKITNFGVFVELESDLEGLLHVSELADHKVEDPHSEVKIGEKVLVKILRVDSVERKIGLSKKRADWSAAQEDGTVDDKRPKLRRGGLHGAGEDTTSLINPMEFIKSARSSEESEGNGDDSTASGDEGGDEQVDSSCSDQAGGGEDSTGGDPDAGADEPASS